jgi:NTE family protein
MRKTNTGKTALVLAGGGLTGAVYEIGALRAIDDVLLDRSVNDFDIYVGTSAGALIAASMANGQSPEDILRVIEGSNPKIKPLQAKIIFGWNPSEWLNWSIDLAPKLFQAWVNYLKDYPDTPLSDIFWSLTDAVPPGLYDALSLEKYIRESFVNLGQSNHFEDLTHELYIIATELDSGERVIFGKGARADVPISLAVAASSALPILYRPVRIGDKEYIDGSLRGNASLDLAIENGATLIICINPLVPYDYSSEPARASLPRKTRYLSEQGFQAVTNQTLRITSYAGLHYHIKQLRRAHPEVDIILIEPDPHGNQILFDNIMRYSARIMVAQHGFEIVTVAIAENYLYYKQILARHDIPISRRLVIEEINEIKRSDYDPKVIQRILEARSHDCGKSRRDTPVCQLTRALAELELLLEDIEVPD